jgi:hypothetical protein
MDSWLLIGLWAIETRTSDVAGTPTPRVSGVDHGLFAILFAQVADEDKTAVGKRRDVLWWMGAGVR